MSFWKLSDGESANQSEAKEFDGGGGNLEPIPEGTTVLASPDDAKWAEDRNNNEYLSIRWSILKPVDYQGRKVFQKLWLTDDDPRAKDPAKKRDKAVQMLAAIDRNAGGKLGRKDGKPTDDELALALTNKQMTIRLGMWELEGDDGKPVSGNYVQAVGAKDKPISDNPAPHRGNGGNTRRAPTPNNAGSFADDLDDDVPFITSGF